MKSIRVEDAVGQTLLHDLTRIVRGEFKGAQFKKGHIIREEDIPMLLAMGKEHVYVCEMDPRMLHEDEGALRLLAITRNDGMLASDVREGKVELRAEHDGFFVVDTERLDAINACGELMIATRRSNTPVHAGDKLAGMRVIPLAIDGKKLDEADRIADGRPILSLLPYGLKTAGVIVTGSEVASGRIKDAFTPVIEEKLAQYAIQLTERAIVGDGMEGIVAAIAAMRKSNIDLLLCTGGMSVDPDDNTPGAIKRSGASIVTYGAPVLPGAMFLVGYYDDGLPVMGLPGCVMYAATTIFDIILPRVAAKVRLERRDITALGNGGLCLECKPCRYPNCPFGK